MMRSVTSISRSAVICIALTGCFDPDDPGLDTDNESTSSGPGQTDDGPGQTDDGPSPTDDGPRPTDDGPATDDGPETGGDSETADPVDDPPAIESFTINGETKILEQTRAGRFDVVAEVVDDNGVDRVEFFHNGELVSTDTEEPFEFSLVLASEHNGTQTFWATAYDTADQSVQSDQLALSMNADGGERIELREDLGLIHIPYAEIFHRSSAPKLEAAADGDILITATARNSTGSDYNTGLIYIRFDEQLSLLQDEAYYGPGRYDYFSPPEFNTTGSARTITSGCEFPGAGSANAHRFFFIQYPSATLELGEPREISCSTAGGDIPTTISPSGEITTLSNSGIVRFSPDGATVQWSIDQDGVFGLLALDDGGVLIRFADSVRRLTDTGETLWTRESPSGTPGGGLWPPVRSDMEEAPNGNLAVPFLSSVYIFSPTGEPLAEQLLIDLDPAVEIEDVAFSPTGSLVVVGDASYEPWLANIATDGEVLWQTSDNFDPSGTAATGVVVSPDGRVFVAGATGPGAGPSLDGDYADLWLGEYGL